MRQTMLNLWSDDGGAIIAVEWIFFVVIVLIGLIVGFVAVRNAVTDELTAVANAVDSLSVCYAFSGLSNCEASVCGSQVINLPHPQINTLKTPPSNLVIITQNPCQ